MFLQTVSIDWRIIELFATIAILSNESKRFHWTVKVSQKTVIFKG